MKVENMYGVNGNKVANQFIIRDGNKITFQSYTTVIAIKENGLVTLDKNSWNYSATTSKYRNIFLDETTAETKKKIKSGIYNLADLNN
jgi:hypothetical protein